MNCLNAAMVAAVVLGAVGAFGATVTLQQGAGGYTGTIARDMWDPGTPGGVYPSSDDYMLVDKQ